LLLTDPVGNKYRFSCINSLTIGCHCAREA